MKKSILISTILLFSLLLFIAATSCKNLPGEDAGEKWLKSIFECQNGNGYCLPEDSKVFTERYLEFHSESIGIFEYPDFETDEELIAAENAFKNKWKDIYAVDKYIWSPFGYGNGMEAGDRLENVTITHISDLKYSVLVEYRNGMIFSNELLLIPSGEAFLIDYIATDFKEQKAMQLDLSNPGVDKILPIFMSNEPNTILYDEASTDSQILFSLEEGDNRSLIGLTAVKDAENRIWYKCYYPIVQSTGWTYQVSHWDTSEGEKLLPFLQNMTLANLQLGANPHEAERLLGKPQSESSETGPMEVSGYIDEDNIVTTTTMDYDGIHLVYEDNRMIQASITKPGKSFGWIICGDKACDKNFLIKKFKLTPDDFHINAEGVQIVYIQWPINVVTVYFDENELVKTIEFYVGS